MSCCGKSGVKGVIKPLVHGAIGLMKAGFRIERPPDTLIASRTAVCVPCEHRKFGPADRLSDMSFCRLCNCRLKSKIAVAGESCCAGKW